MRINRYTKAVDEIKAPERAVEKMMKTMKDFEEKEKVISMKKWIKGAVAASLVVAVTAGSVIGFNLFGNKAENAFVMKVGAAELSAEKSVSIGIDEDKGLNLSEGSDSIAAFSVGTAIVCEGKDIKSVTYSVDSGSLIVTSRRDNNPVISGTKSEDNRSYPYSLSMTEEDQDELNAIIDKESPDSTLEEQNAAENAVYARYTQSAYTSVTFAYDNQKPDGSSFYYAGFAEDLNDEDYKFLKNHKDELFNCYGNEQHFDVQKNCLDKLIGRSMHCTVTYNDGTEQKQDIMIGAKVSTYSKEYPEEYASLPDDVKVAKDYKGVFVTYTVKA